MKNDEDGNEFGNVPVILSGNEEAINVKMEKMKWIPKILI